MPLLLASRAVTNLDVTPVGLAPGEHGRPPVRHGRGWVRIVAGALLFVGAAVALAVGIVGFVREQGELIDGAVATGRVGGEAVRFEAEEGPYTVMILTPGGGDSVRLEREVAATACAVRRADGGEAQVRGNRQGVSTTTDGASSIGVFDLTAGAATVRCARVRAVAFPARREFIVTPGKSSFATLALPFGHRRRRRADRRAAARVGPPRARDRGAVAQLLGCTSCGRWSSAERSSWVATWRPRRWRAATS